MVTTKVEQTERMDSWYRNVFQWTGIVRETLGAEHWDSAIHKAPGVIEDPTNPRLIIEAGRAADTPADQAAKIWYESGLRIVKWPRVRRPRQPRVADGPRKRRPRAAVHGDL